MFDAIRLKWAAKRYAKKLRGQLIHDYGADKFDTSADGYTEPQIRRAVIAAGLNRYYIALGYAPFLSKKSYEALLDLMPLRLGYVEARTLFVSFEPVQLTSETGPAMASLGQGGGNADSACGPGGISC